MIPCDVEARIAVSCNSCRLKGTVSIAGISVILCLVKFTHHGLQVELPDDWWTEAGMRGFVPTFTAYRVNQRLFQNVREVSVHDVGLVSRNPGAGIFNDSEEEGSARERVVRILRSFRFDNAIPPVEIVEGQLGFTYRYKLVRGADRFYCSVAAGFKNVPTIKGFDRDR
jgi:hypothetical protein